LIDDIAFRQRLDEIERGIGLIRRTRDRDSQRVMLGFLLKDLDRLGQHASTAPRRHRAGYQALADEALALRRQIGEPVAPDAVPQVPVRRKRRKETRPVRKRPKRPAPKLQTFDSFRRKNPAATIWLDLGIRPRTATALCKAGYLTLEQIAPLTREDLLALWSVGDETLEKLATALGRPLKSITGYWEDLGLPNPAAQILTRHKIETLEQLKAMEREPFLTLPGMGPRLLKQIEQALKMRIKSRYSYWTDRGLTVRTARILHKADISTLRQLAGQSYEVLRSLEIHVADLIKISRLTLPLAGTAGEEV